MNAHLYLSPVVQKLDSTTQEINHHQVDKYNENQLRYPPFEQQSKMGMDHCLDVNLSRKM